MKKQIKPKVRGKINEYLNRLRMEKIRSDRTKYSYES